MHFSLRALTNSLNIVLNHQYFCGTWATNCNSVILSEECWLNAGGPTPAEISYAHA